MVYKGVADGQMIRNQQAVRRRRRKSDGKIGDHSVTTDLENDAPDPIHGDHEESSSVSDRSS
jgi:hypothetical protein